jgi:hypothetical protein
MKRKFTLLSLSLGLSLALSAQTPIAYYPLDGNANDISGSNFNGIMSGSPLATTNRWSASGTALNFDGINDYINLPTSFDFPNRTIIVWFNAAQIDATNNGNMIYSSDHGGIQYGLTAIILKKTNGSDSLILGVGSNGRYKAPVTTSQWYQVAIVRSTSSAKFYVNGVLLGSGNNPDRLHSADGPQNAIIGADRYYRSPFNGKIDDLRIYDVALSDAEIGGNYTSVSEIRAIESKLNLLVQDGKVSYWLDEPSDKEIKTASIFDLSGKLISEIPNAAAGQPLNQAELPEGVYIIRFSFKDELHTISRKFVISR